MKHTRSVLAFVFCAGTTAFSLTVPEGTTVDTEQYVFISDSSNENELIVNGSLKTSKALIVGDFCYYSVAQSSGSGVIEAQSVYVGSSSRGCSFLIVNGGRVRTSSFNLYGDATTGIAYGELQNYVSVTGSGSLLDVQGHLNIWSPDVPGQPGDPFDLPREIPAYLRIANGAEVAVDSISVTNGSWVSINPGGKLTIRSDFDVSSAGNLNHMDGGTLSVAGEVRGLSMLEEGRVLEASSVYGNLNVKGLFTAGSSSNACLVQGNLELSESGTLEVSCGGGLTVSGETKLAGNLRVLVDETSALAAGDSLQIFNFEGGLTGGFESVEPIASGDLAWDVSQLNTTGVLHVIPEPATLALMSMSGGIIYALRRRKSVRFSRYLHMCRHVDYR